MTGRPSFEPTDAQRELVSALAACGVRQEIIARRIGIDAKTLRKTCRRELREGKQDACAIVAESLFRMATGTGRNACTAAIFWLKTQAHWKETQAHALVGLDGQSRAAPVLKIDLPETMTEEESRAAYLEMINGPAA